MEARSAWTGRRVAGLVSVKLPVPDRLGRPAGEKEFWVEPMYEAELRRWVDYANRYGRRFLGLVFALSAISLAGAFLGPVWEGAYWIVVASLVGLGATIVVYPFATPETNAMLGMRKARALARAAGWFTIAMAFFLAFRLAF